MPLWADPISGLAVWCRGARGHRESKAGSTCSAWNDLWSRRTRGRNAAVGAPVTDKPWGALETKRRVTAMRHAAGLRVEREEGQRSRTLDRRRDHRSHRPTRSFCRPASGPLDHVHGAARRLLRPHRSGSIDPPFHGPGRPAGSAVGRLVGSVVDGGRRDHASRRSSGPNCVGARHHPLPRRTRSAAGRIDCLAISAIVGAHGARPEARAANGNPPRIADFAPAPADGP
jgi:hypothetical protein